MKRSRSTSLVLLVVALLLSVKSDAQKAANWTENQLMDPADLAKALNDQKDIPLIISVGPGATIPSSIGVGMVNTDEGLKKLKLRLQSLDKGGKLVVYCGCCPFEHCPNVRPAIEVLKEMQFTRYYLLNLPQNIKKDWIDKGYPVSKS